MLLEEGFSGSLPEKTLRNATDAVQRVTSVLPQLAFEELSERID